MVNNTVTMNLNHTTVSGDIELIPSDGYKIDNTDLKLEAVKAGQDYFAIKYVTGNT